MKAALKLFGIFLAMILFLSIEIGNKPIFGHIYKFISPATKGAQNLTASLFDSSLNKTHQFSKKLFENSIPKSKDSIKLKMSALSKHKSSPQEKITDEEKQELDSLIKSH